MPNVAHFAVAADDLGRAREFYERVFGWRFEAWGPPDFFRIITGGDGDIEGALEKRAAPLADGGANAFICTISVDDIDETARLIEQHGGTIVHPKMVIPGVGAIVQFRDTEGNTVSAMQYQA